LLPSIVVEAVPFTERTVIAFPRKSIRST